MNKFSRVKALKREIENQRIEFKAEYDVAYTQLNMHAVSMKRNCSETEHIQDFISTGIRLSQVCEMPQSDRSALEVLYWLLNKVKAEQQKSHRDGEHLLMCQKGIALIENTMKEHCLSLDPSGKVSPLL